MWRVLLALGSCGLCAGAGAGAEAEAEGWAEQWRRTRLFTIIDPVFGPVTPSSDIRSFADFVFGGRRQNVEGAANAAADDADDADATTNSGEAMRPKDVTNKANLGFEQYWPKGEWVYKKAEVDFCNSSATCGEMITKFGAVCAGNHDLTAHHTFSNMCEMDDANCRDGSYTVFTTLWDVENKSITWIPITTSGHVTMKISTSQPKLWFILTRNKNFFSRPKRAFVYAHSCWRFRTCVRIVAGDSVYLPDEWYWNGWDWRSYIRYHDYRLADPEYHWERSRSFLINRKVHQWKLTWNETTGFVEFVMILRNGTEYQPLTDTNKSKAFPARYLGIAGGTVAEPAWWEIYGPGYLMAYRGRCRSDLPTLPTEQPARLRHNLDIDMYNFAERMDEFGYNFSRVTNRSYHYYDQDDDKTYTN